MSELSLNLTKISRNQPKLVVERFFVGQNIGLVRWTGEEKRIYSNNIHLREREEKLKDGQNL